MRQAASVHTPCSKCHLPALSRAEYRGELRCLPNKLRAHPAERRNRPWLPPTTPSLEEHKDLQKPHPRRHRKCHHGGRGFRSKGTRAHVRIVTTPELRGQQPGPKAVLTGRPRTELGRDADVHATVSCPPRFPEDLGTLPSPPGSPKTSAHSTRREPASSEQRRAHPEVTGSTHPRAEGPAAGAPRPAGSGGPPHSPRPCASEMGECS